jgi:hypothetical protein
MAPPRRPDPEPLETDDVRAVTVGTVAWGVLLVVLLVSYQRLDDDGRGSWVWIAAAGFGLGLLGVRHVRRRRAALSRAVPPPGDRSGDAAPASSGEGSDPSSGTSPGR